MTETEAWQFLLLTPVVALVMGGGIWFLVDWLPALVRRTFGLCKHDKDLWRTKDGRVWCDLCRSHIQEADE